MLSTTNYPAIFEVVTDMVTIHAFYHNLWVRDALVALPTVEERFEWNEPHQDILLNVYCQHDEINNTAAVIHSSLELNWIAIWWKPCNGTIRHCLHLYTLLDSNDTISTTYDITGRNQKPRYWAFGRDISNLSNLPNKLSKKWKL